MDAVNPRAQMPIHGACRTNRRRPTSCASTPRRRAHGRRRSSGSAGTSPRPRRAAAAARPKPKRRPTAPHRDPAGRGPARCSSRAGSPGRTRRRAGRRRGSAVDRSHAHRRRRREPRARALHKTADYFDGLYATQGSYPHLSDTQLQEDPNAGVRAQHGLRVVQPGRGRADEQGRGRIGEPAPARGQGPRQRERRVRLSGESHEAGAVEAGPRARGVRERSGARFTRRSSRRGASCARSRRGRACAATARAAAARASPTTRARSACVG